MWLGLAVVKGPVARIGGCAVHNRLFCRRKPSQPPISTTKTEKWQDSGVVKARADEKGGCESAAWRRWLRRAVVTMLAAGLVTPVMPYFLAFAAGAMMYVVVEELIPEMSEGKHSNTGTIAFSLGFVLMMILDVALG